MRTQHDPGTGPQFNYLPPHIAIDPHYGDTLMMRRKQLLDVLAQAEDPGYPALVMEMIADLDFPVRVRVAPTVRARDGLALSSRNARLSASERAQAPALYRALQAGARHLKRTRKAAAAERAMRGVLAEARLASVDYAALVDPSTFAQPGRGARKGLLVVAARFPSARLIDNLPVRLGGAR